MKKLKDKCKVIAVIFAVIGVIAVIAGAVIAVRKFLRPNYLDDFKDDFDEDFDDDFDDDFFNEDDEAEAAEVESALTEEELEAVKADAEAPAVVPSEETVEE